MTFDELEELHYITPLVNVKSIIERGILSHQKSEKITHEEKMGTGTLSGGQGQEIV